MSVQHLGRDELAARAVVILGLDDTTTDLYSVEALCAALRRAASYLCPTSPRQIVDAVLETLTPLGDTPSRDDLDEALAALIGAGDLLELRQTPTGPRTLFLGPPSYVEKYVGDYLLLGIRPNGAPILDTQISADIIYMAHTRSLTLDPDNAAESLAAAGLHRWDRSQWCRMPREQSAAAVIAQARQHLDRAPSRGVVSGLTIIDAAARINYYKGRWREPAPVDNGLFVGRRPQAYGAPIWCLVRLEAGVPQAILDLPVSGSLAPSWDEARRVQAALDADRGVPQEFRIRSMGQDDGACILDVFAPLPSWAERHLTLVGWPTTRSKGALASYWIPDDATTDVKAYLTNRLWMIDSKEDQEQ